MEGEWCAVLCTETVCGVHEREGRSWLSSDNISFLQLNVVATDPATP